MQSVVYVQKCRDRNGPDQNGSYRNASDRNGQTESARAKSPVPNFLFLILHTSLLVRLQEVVVAFQAIHMMIMPDVQVEL